MSSGGDQKAGSNANESSHHDVDNVQVQTMDTNTSIPETIDTNTNSNTNMSGMLDIDIDWQNVLSDPSLVPCFLEEPSVRETVGRSKIDSTTAGLTYIPWELKVKVAVTSNKDDVNPDTASIPVVAVAVAVAPSTITTNGDNNADNKDADIDANDQKPPAIAMSKNASSNISTDHNSSSNTLAQQQQPYFPVDLATGQSTDYLSLRRQQNRAWADERLLSGIQLAQQNKYSQAEKAYQQGLDLVPNHVDLMVAAAALHANQGTANNGNRDSGKSSSYHQTRALQLLEQALREDPHHANAAQYKQEIEAYQQKQQLAATLAQRPAKADRAMQDASLERSFEIGHTNNGGGASASAVNHATAYPLLGSDSEHDNDRDDDKRSRKHKKRKHKKRHKKKSKRHHRHRRHRSSSYYDSDSDTDDNDDDTVDDDSASRSRKRSRGKSKRRKDKKRSRDRKEESEPTKETSAGAVPESIGGNGSHHDKDYDYDTDDSFQEDSTRRSYKRRRKDRKHKRPRLSIRDDVSSSAVPSDSGETVDSLQIGLERKGGRPATRAFRHEEERDDETKGG